jgi:hypothetical protein
MEIIVFKSAQIILMLLTPTLVAAQTCPNPSRVTRGASGPMAVVRYLADDALEGRLAGSPGERCAGDFIAARFQQLGLKPGGDSGSFFQEVRLASTIDPHRYSGTSRNVIAVLPGSDSVLKDEWIVVGAHYDHLGRLAAPDPIHNGADDNASGVAALLDVARQLTVARPARSIAFVAFTGEEGGLLGSAHFVAHPTINLVRTRAMLNLDMVGRLGQGPLIVYGTGTASEWQRIVDAATAAVGVKYKAQPEGFGPSDHTSFYLKDIPVLHFFTNVHLQYHKPSDDWALIDAAGLRKVATVAARAALAAASPQQSLTLVRGVGRPPSSMADRRGYGAYLGSIPDFAPVERGVKLSGVTPGSPAEKAGLMAGDVIIRFDQEEIADLEGMTAALRSRKPGDKVSVTVLRDGRELTVTALLGSR